MKAKPKYISIENLNNKKILMNGNRSLSRQWACCNFRYFKEFLTWKCKGIELRLVDTFYPSSKTCCNCGNIKEKLTLKTRVYKCKKMWFRIR